MITQFKFLHTNHYFEWPTLRRPTPQCLPLSDIARKNLGSEIGIPD